MRIIHQTKQQVNETINNKRKYQLEEEHINELQEWEGLSSG
jgi:hypothetical protein